MSLLLGRTSTARAGNALLVLGAALLAWAVLWQTGLAPGSRVTVPEPVALAGSGARRVAIEPTAVAPAAIETTSQAPAAAAEQPALPLVADAPRAPARAGLGLVAPEHASPAEAGTLPVAPAAFPLPADRPDRLAAASQPKPGRATRLAIESISLETTVQQAGIKLNARGEPEWETLPFVAAHYGDLTALVGGRGNAVIAGHVVTLSEGNVFRNLYRLSLGDTITVWDEADVERTFGVVEIKLVPPSDTSVMESPSAEPMLTLITCGGTFDPVKREFSDRLIVVARPLA